MSDTLRVWEFRVEFLSTRRSCPSLLFYDKKDAEKEATEYVMGPINWTHPKDEHCNYVVGFSVDEPQVAFFLRRVEVR